MTFVKDRVVRGMPRHPQPRRDPRHRKVIDDEGTQRPRQSTAGEFRPRLCRRAQIVSPVAVAGVATVAADTDKKSRGPAAERFMRETARLCAKRTTSSTTPTSSPSKEPATDSRTPGSRPCHPPGPKTRQNKHHQWTTFQRASTAATCPSSGVWGHTPRRTATGILSRRKDAFVCAASPRASACGCPCGLFLAQPTVPPQQGE